MAPDCARASLGAASRSADAPRAARRRSGMAVPPMFWGKACRIAARPIKQIAA
jgi:hypothetical protein